MKVLLTNDDGMDAAGLWAVFQQLQLDQRVTSIEVIAPAEQQSGVSHGVTYLVPLLPREESRHGQPVWTVPGTPADCVKLGIVSLLDCRPDVVISGINAGLNSGINTIYSGTVAAAREGTFFQLPSVAVSLEDSPEMNFQAAAQLTIPRILDLLADALLQRPTHGARMMNINVPSIAVQEYVRGGQPQWKAVAMKLTRYEDTYWEREDPQGRKYYWSTDEPFSEKSVVDTDVDALAGAVVTVTPLQYDLTDYQMLQQLDAYLG